MALQGFMLKKKKKWQRVGGSRSLSLQPEDCRGERKSRTPWASGSDGTEPGPGSAAVPARAPASPASVLPSD